MLECVAITLFLLTTVKCMNHKPDKPHIIIIVADDLGWDDVSFHGSNQIPTPNIDGLANSGIILNNYYVSPICTPSRSAIMTGKHPIHTGMQHSVAAAGRPFGVGLNETFLSQYLKGLGYSTHAIGKWHLGFYKLAYTPTKRGFDSFFGIWGGKADYWDHSAEEPAGWGLDLRNNTEPVRTEWGHYGTDLFTEKATDVIQSHDTSKPLFMYLAHQATHNANSNQLIQAPGEIIKKFSNIENERRRIFAAMATVVDTSVGEVIKALKAKGMYNNSVIVFTTDNGGPAAGLDGNSACNFPLRGMKTTLWEGGVRGVAFVHSPLLESSGRVSMDMMHVTDWVPTLYVLAGGDIHKLHALDGYDMWPTLSEGKESPRQEILHNIDPITERAAMRHLQWKLVVNESTSLDKWYRLPGANANTHNSTTLKNAVVTCKGEEPAKPSECTKESGPCLFNIEEDPCEYTNLADKEPDIVKALLGRLEAYRKTMVPPRFKPADPAANPRFHGGLWVPWKDL